MIGLGLWWSLALAPPPVCEVAVEGMPVTVMRHHRLAVGSKAQPLLPRMSITPEEQRVRLRVTGPRYRGERWLSADDCARGQPLSLVAVPLPASLMFSCPPDGLTVECLTCAGEVRGQIFLARDVPTFDVRDFNEEFEVVLRAPGFRREVRRLVLHPGPNMLKVELVALGAR